MIGRNLILNRVLLLSGILVFTGSFLRAQSPAGLSLDSCYVYARKNYPLVKQLALLESSKNYSLSNASKGYLPQLQIAGQASYQSDVTEIPIVIPNLTIPSLRKDQYKIYGEINQPLTDAITIRQQKALIEANADAEVQKLEVELYKLKERVNQLFFGMLLIDEQLQQTVLLKKDIQSGLDKTNAAILNGIASKNNSELLQAELLKAEQRRIELAAARKGYADMLALFINQKITEQTKLLTPEPQAAVLKINRPETRLFEMQKKTLEVQHKLLTTRTIPRVSLFVQSGLGRPALNMFTNSLDFYYIGGLRLNWNLTAYYTSQKDRQLLSLNQRIVDVQQETFLFATGITLSQQNSEIEKYRDLLVADNQIVALRGKVKQSAASQLENGTLSAIDYLSCINAEDQAKQNQLLHQLQLLMAQYNYQTTSGN